MSESYIEIENRISEAYDAYSARGKPRALHGYADMDITEYLRSTPYREIPLACVENKVH
jgi:hypothetical protein